MSVHAGPAAHPFGLSTGALLAPRTDTSPRTSRAPTPDGPE